MAYQEVSDAQLENYKILAKTRIDEGHPADPAALEIIIQLCDVILTERHPKPLFHNLWYQGAEDDTTVDL
jgi:hypothetical protein